MKRERNRFKKDELREIEEQDELNEEVAALREEEGEEEEETKNPVFEETARGAVDEEMDMQHQDGGGEKGAAEDAHKDLSTVFGHDYLTSLFNEPPELEGEEEFEDNRMLDEDERRERAREARMKARLLMEEKVVSTDVPERLQPRDATRILDTVVEETRWIFRHAFAARGRSPNMVPIMEQVIRFLREEKLEMPFIILYKRDIYLHTGAESDLTEADLWLIDEWDEKWTRLAKTKSELLKVRELRKEGKGVFVHDFGGSGGAGYG